MNVGNWWECSSDELGAMNLSDCRSGNQALVTISREIILNFQLEFLKKVRRPFISYKIHFLAFKRLVNKNFSYLIFLFNKII